MSQKTQRRIARQKKVELVWAGPAVVSEQRAVRRVPIGHRGATMRKALFADSDESGDSSGGGTDKFEFEPVAVPKVDEAMSRQN